MCNRQLADLGERGAVDRAAAMFEDRVHRARCSKGRSGTQALGGGILRVAHACRRDTIFRPHKSVIHVAVRLEKTEETTAELEASGLDVGDYDLKPGRYRFRLAKGDLEKHREL